MLPAFHLKIKRIFEKPIVVVGAISLFGALIRLYGLGFKPLWFDEAVLYWIARSGSLRSILSQNAINNSAPPLFAFLLNLTQKIGDSETVLRLLPWFGGVLAIPAIYFLARQFLERTPAYLVTFVVAIATSQVTYSQQLREYSWTFLTATIILALFVKQLQTHTWNNLALLTMAMSAGIFLQYGLALLILALNIVYLVDLYSRKDDFRGFLLIQWIISQSIVLGAVVGVYFAALRRQMVIGFGITPTSTYLPDAYWDGSIKSLFMLAVNNTGDILLFAYPTFVFALVVAMGVFFALRDRHYKTALMMFAFPILLTFLAACARLYPYAGFRQDIFLLPMLYVFFGLGIQYLLKFAYGRWMTIFLILFSTVVGCKATLDYLKYPGSEDLRPVAAALSERFEAGDKVYVYYSAKPAFTYYYRDHHESQIYGISSRGKPRAYYGEINALLKANPDARIWMVFSHCYLDECKIIPEYVSKRRSVEMIFSDGRNSLYLIR